MARKNSRGDAAIDHARGSGGRVAAKARHMFDTIRQNNRILAYCGLILVCSMLSLPEEYKIDKKNILNQWFVKVGWFWTLVSLVPLVFSPVKVNDREGVSQAIFRLITSTVVWYISVNFFQLVDTNTGFDISGHTFLLMFSNLLISSELKMWDQMSKQSRGGDGRELQDGLVASKANPVRYSVTVLSVLWDFMLMQTALYYHTMIQKVLAAVWAIVSWYLLHSLFYHRATYREGETDFR